MVCELSVSLLPSHIACAFSFSTRCRIRLTSSLPIAFRIARIEDKMLISLLASLSLAGNPNPAQPSIQSLLQAKDQASLRCLRPGRSGTLDLAGDHLIAGREGKVAGPILVESCNVLFVPGQPRTRRIFQRDFSGHVVGFVERRESEDLIWKRISTLASKAMMANGLLQSRIYSHRFTFWVKSLYQDRDLLQQRTSRGLRATSHFFSRLPRQKD